MEVKNVTPYQLNEWLKNNEATLIDVREPEEYYKEYIPNSKLIPVKKLTLQTLPYLAPKIVLHCKSGGRSTNACIKLLQENPNLEIYNLEGGILAWVNAGLPTQHASQDDNDNKKI